jgi:hypothetical protein
MGLLVGAAAAQETLSSVQRELDRVEREIEREKDLHKTERKRAADFEGEKASKLKALQDQIRQTQGRIDSLKGQLIRARGQKGAHRAQTALYQNKQKEFAKALTDAIRKQAEATAKDFPYQREKRVSDLNDLAAAIDNGVVAVEDGMGRFFTLLQASMDFAYDTEVYRGSWQAEGGASHEGNYVRLGAALLAFASEDGQHAAYLAKADSGYGWVDVSASPGLKADIQTAVQVAQGKVAPQLVKLPFPAPRVRAAGESKEDAP